MTSSSPARGVGTRDVLDDQGTVELVDYGSLHDVSLRETDPPSRVGPHAFASPEAKVPKIRTPPFRGPPTPDTTRLT